MEYIRKETFSGSQIDRIRKEPEICIEIKCKEDKDKSILREITRKSIRDIRRLTGKRVRYSVKTF